MNEAEQVKEREIDNRWTTPRLVVVGLLTLTVALTIIDLLAGTASPY